MMCKKNSSQEGKDGNNRSEGPPDCTVLPVSVMGPNLEEAHIAHVIGPIVRIEGQVIDLDGLHGPVGATDLLDIRIDWNLVQLVLYGPLTTVSCKDSLFSANLIACSPTSSGLVEPRAATSLLPFIRHLLFRAFQEWKTGGSNEDQGKGGLHAELQSSKASIHRTLPHPGWYVTGRSQFFLMPESCRGSKS